MCRLFALLMLILPYASWAETARVTSGEHDGFSRLVVTLAQPASWTLGRLDGGYQLQIENPELTFDLSDAFRRISKARLAGVEAGWGGVLNIALACNCHAEAFEFRPGIIVIDLKSGSAKKGSPFEAVMTPKTAVHPLAVDRKVERAPLPLDDLALDLMRKTIAEGLGAAASEGNVDLRLPASTRPGSDEGTMDRRSVHIRVMQPEGLDGKFAENPHSLACLDDSRFELRASTGSDRPEMEFAFLYHGLAGDMDEPQPQIATLAAWRALSLGFGAEAAQLVKVFASDTRDAPILLAIAAIVDDDPIVTNPFEGMESCSSLAALWSVLARSYLRPGEPVNTGAIFLGYSDLPVNLRQLLGPRLAERFVQNGDTEMVRKIRDAIARASDGASGVVRLVDASLDASNLPEKAEKTYQEIAAGHDAMEPAALIGLVDLALVTGTAIDARKMQDLEILASQRRGQPDAAALQRAYALSLALDGQFSQSLAEAKDERTKIDVWTLLSEKAGTSDLLMLASDTDQAPDGLPKKTAELLATRFLDLGLPEVSERWTNRAGMESGEPAARVFTARLAQMRRDAASTLRLLAGFGGVEAERLRGEALMQMDMPSEAVGAFLRAGDTEEMHHALRVSRAWRAVSEQDQGVWRDAAEMAIDPPLETSPEKPLATVRNLLDLSARARLRVQELLEAETKSESPS